MYVHCLLELVSNNAKHMAHDIKCNNNNKIQEKANYE